MISGSYVLSKNGQSILRLLDPRGQTRLFVAALLTGLVVGWLGMSRLNAPLWAASLLTLALLLFPTARKWQADYREHGAPIALLSGLLVAQGVHTVEHLAQWVQYHLLGWPIKAASGFISPLNAEVVHFAWNWGVLLAVAFLLLAGLRNRWMWLLLIWATAHTAEHTYMFINYLQMTSELASAGLPTGAAQGLPGFFGRGGWLSTNMPSSGPVAFVCTLVPGLVEAPRLDVHFWWNVGEVALLLPAAHASMRRLS